ncbi:MAG: glycerol-3-phosphate 1-O-acyltransferase PlsY [Helicobacteraceae bacterium]
MPVLSSLGEFFSNANVLIYLLAYLIGAIPFGLLLAKVFAGVNIKKSGSGSIGATNVLRVVKEKDPRLGKILGIATFVCDFLKGGAVILLARLAGFEDPSIAWTIAVLAVVGHCFSPYLMFEGGKGVATGVGVVMVMLPLEAILGLVAWLIVGKKFKVSSLASLAGLLSAIAFSFVLHPEIVHTPLLILGFVIFYKHIPNIYRLITHKEKAVI